MPKNACENGMWQLGLKITFCWPSQCQGVIVKVFVNVLYCRGSHFWGSCWLRFALLRFSVSRFWLSRVLLLRILMPSLLLLKCSFLRFFLVKIPFVEVLSVNIRTVEVLIAKEDLIVKVLVPCRGSRCQGFQLGPFLHILWCTFVFVYFISKNPK